MPRPRFDVPAALLRCLAVAGLAALAALVGFLLANSVPLLASGVLRDLAAWRWDPTSGHFGLLPMLVGSLLLSILAVGLAFPLALGVVAFVETTRHFSLRRAVLMAVHFMTGVPTVLYGFVSVFLLVALLRRLSSYGSGYSLAAASVTLALLILPGLVLVIESEARSMGRGLRLAAAALGMTPMQAFLFVELPLLRRSVVRALVLAFGRALGDTMIALMVSGNAPIVPHSLLDPMRTLTAHIALALSTDASGTAYRSVFASALLLILMLLVARWFVGVLVRPGKGEGG